MDAASTTSSEGSRRKRHHTGSDKVNKKRKHQAHLNGDRRDSVSTQPPRDPRDIPERHTKKSKKSKSKNTAVFEKEDGEAEDLKLSNGLATRSPSPMVDFDGLSRPSKGTRDRLEETKEQYDQRMQKMAGAWRTILECVGEDVDREGLKATPMRAAKAFDFITKGYHQNVRDIVNNAIFEENHNEMVIVKDIEIFSTCEHHMVPFLGKMHIGYIPDQSVIGLSKLPRIAELFARRLQIQERLTKDVANTIMEVLKPQGVAVVMESSHLCMVMRGVQKSTATTITSCVLGCFEQREKTRNEFMSLIGINR